MAIGGIAIVMFGVRALLAAAIRRRKEKEHEA